MVKTIVKFIPTVVSIVFWVGLQMSGIVIPWLGYLLMGLAVILLLIPGWPYVRHIHLRWPIVLQHETGTSNKTSPHSLSWLNQEVMNTKIKPLIYDDKLTGHKIVIQVSPRYFKVFVDDRVYYFNAETGEFDGTSTWSPP